MTTTQKFVVLAVFLVIMATPWMVYHNAQAMCYESMMQAMGTTY